MESLIFEYSKKYKNTLFLLSGFLLLVLFFNYSQNTSKEEPPLSLDHMIPEGFVLIPVEIVNKEDIISFMGRYGVVNLYSYSVSKNIPEDIVALSLKVIPPSHQDSRFSAIVPEQQVSQLFQHESPFYAVIQNPKKKNSQIIKKKIKKPLIVIEEGI